MKSKSFDDLTLVERAWLIYEFGQQLTSIEYYDYRIDLYALNGDYIESYRNIATRQIEQISIASYSDLDKYLPRILLGMLKGRMKK
jgi:hypothetical protein